MKNNKGETTPAGSPDYIATQVPTAHATHAPTAHATHDHTGYTTQAPTSPASESDTEVHCGTWGSGAYKTQGGDIYYAKCESTVALFYHCSQEALELAVQVKRNIDGSFQTIYMKVDSSEVEIRTTGISVNSQVVPVPYMSKSFRIYKCGMFTKLTSFLSAFSMIFDIHLSVILQMKKVSEICGICGDSEIITEENWKDYFTKNIIGEYGKIEFQTSDPDDEGTAYCSKVIKRNFLSLENEDQDKYIKICACEYNGCTEDDKRTCACSTFTELARVCGSTGCSDELSAWRKDDSVPCGIPRCPKTQIFDECAPISQPTCSNPAPIQDKGVISGCTCPKGLVIDDIGGTNACIDIIDCPCSFGGKIYQSGDKRQSTCNSECSCSGGEWHCSEGKCRGTCKIENGIHVTTYDTKKYNLHGNCNYVISRGEDWLISAEITQAMNGQSTSSLASVALFLNMDNEETKFVIRKDGVISNGGITFQKYYESDAVQIKCINNIIHMTVKNGLEMLLSMQPTMQMYISVPDTGFKNTRGLCGSFNYIAEDDFMSNQNIPESSPEAFSRSWAMSACPHLDPPTCMNLDYERFAEQHCSQLKDPIGPFATCHFDVDYRTYYERCVSATCKSKDIYAGLCTALENYAMACAENGILLNNWRDDICKKECKKNQILQHNYVSCFHTCYPRSLPEQTCVKEVFMVEECGCPEGQYLNNEDICVFQADCDCYLGTDVVPAHTKFEVDGNMCECFEGSIFCMPGGNEETQLCPGGAEFVNCNYPNTQRRVDLDCSTKYLPIMQQDEDCKPGCYCPIDMVRDSKGDCIPSTECPCLYGGTEYKSGSTVAISCNKCVCNKGMWECTTKECQSTCHIYGDGHVTTFDGLWYAFDGLCQYTIVQDYCKKNSGTFRISVQSIPCCEDGLTCSRKVTIFIQGTIITLEDGKTRTEFSGDSDCSSNTHSEMTVGMYNIVALKNGITVVWDRQTAVSVVLDPVWKDKVCGMCGNNNGDMKDDFTERNGMRGTRELELGNSWKDDPFCPDAEAQVFPCDANPYCKSWAQRKCQIIREAIFKDCHLKVDPTPYYDACIREACVCDMEGIYLGFCTSVSKYAQACIAVGVCADWRTQDLCPVCCDHYNVKGENIWHYEPCGSTYVKTCNNQNIADKFAPLLEGCYPRCPSKAPYLDENTMKCVQLSDCSCSYNGKMIAANSMIKDQCGRRCYCLNGNVTCKEETPPPTTSGYIEETTPPTTTVYTGETTPAAPSSYIGQEMQPTHTVYEGETSPQGPSDFIGTINIHK
ncbi:mucin-19-like [Mixophyes fleayi]|uniref:mucin-19-like n=1 Tax=Mixophyes fleayi TaxID=3061075 RepID=UPI003F4E18FF